jgi:hypothetical protein
VLKPHAFASKRHAMCNVVCTTCALPMYAMCIGVCKQRVQTRVERGRGKMKVEKGDMRNLQEVCVRVPVVVGVLCTALGSAAECKPAVHTRGEGVYTYGVGKKWKYTCARRGSLLSSGKYLSAPPPRMTLRATSTCAVCRTCATSVHAVCNAVCRRRVQSGGWGGGV